MHYGDRGLSNIYGTLLASTDETYKLTKVKLDAYFEPQINHTFETYVFRCMRQEDDETVYQFATRLKAAASRCNFHDDKRDQIVMNCLSHGLRKKAIRDDLDLDSLTKAARSNERSDRQASLMEKPNDVNKIRREEGSDKASTPRHRRRKPGKYSNRSHQNRESTNSMPPDVKKCWNCGGKVAPSQRQNMMSCFRKIVRTLYENGPLRKSMSFSNTRT